MSRHQSLVATSAQVFCRLQMVAADVATSISCRDINLMNCSFQLMSSVVATSLHASVGFTGCFWCRDISLLSRQQLKSQQFHLFKPVIASRRFSCRDHHSLSRHQPLSRHHDAVATSRCCRDITMLSRHHSFSFCSILSCLSCDPCRDLHQISFNFPDVATL